MTKPIVHIARGTLAGDEWPKHDVGECGKHSVSSVNNCFDMVTCPRCEHILFNHNEEKTNES